LPHNNVADLQLAIAENQPVHARALLDAYLKAPYYFGDAVAKIGSPGGRDFKGAHKRNRFVIDEKAWERQALLGDPDVKPEIMNLQPGDVVELTEPEAITSKATYSRILNKHFRLIGLGLYTRAAERHLDVGLKPPEFSAGWEDRIRDPANKLLGDFYGNVKNLRVIGLPLTEAFITQNYRYYARNPEEINADDFARMAVLVDLRSSGGRQVSQVIETTIYLQRTVATERVARSSRGRAKGRAGVLALWQESAERGHELEGRMMQRAFKGIGRSSGGGR
jgi:hypothetical protein